MKENILKSGQEFVNIIKEFSFSERPFINIKEETELNTLITISIKGDVQPAPFRINFESEIQKQWLKSWALKFNNAIIELDKL